MGIAVVIFIKPGNLNMFLCFYSNKLCFIKYLQFCVCTGSMIMNVRETRKTREQKTPTSPTASISQPASQQTSAPTDNRPQHHSATTVNTTPAS
jgi:hypothetical protein